MSTKNQANYWSKFRPPRLKINRWSIYERSGSAERHFRREGIILTENESQGSGFLSHDVVIEDEEQSTIYNNKEGQAIGRQIISQENSIYHLARYYFIDSGQIFIAVFGGNPGGGR